MTIKQVSTRQIDMPGADVCLIEGVFDSPKELFDEIMCTTPWRQEKIRFFGREQPMPRLTCWMGDAKYTYSGLENLPAPVNEAVAGVRALVEQLARCRFNGVLLNLYRDGRDSMGWHADDERSLGDTPIIASVNLGAVRRLKFKPKPHHVAAKVDIELPDNSVLIMKGLTQQNWLHAVPKTAKQVQPRINFTFRNILS